MVTNAITADVDSLAEELRREAMLFSSRLENVRSIGCVEGALSSLMGTPAMQQARTLSSQLPWQDIKPLKKAFQDGLAAYYKMANSPHHSRSKPYGYPGDFAILELVYDTAINPDTKSAAGGWVDVHGVQTRLPRAVKARKDALRTWLEEYAETRSHVRLLSVASGSARELREIRPSLLAKFEGTLFDFDPRSLAFAQRAFDARPNPPSIRSLLGDAIKGGATIDMLKSEKPFDVIYSFGLYDYLDDETLLRSARYFLPMLKPDGKFLFCLKDKRGYDAWYYDWFFDWRFVPRTLEDGPRFAEALGLRVTQTLLVEEGTIGIYVCER